MQPPDEFDIRFTEPNDILFLTRCFSQPGTCDDFPFGDDEKDDTLKNWIGFSKFKASLTGMMGTQACAIATLFLMPYRKVAHHASFFIFVDPAYRHKGIGTPMVRNILNLPKPRFRLESVYAEVYEPSLLLPILEKQAFAQIFRQDDYVRINGQSRARILMEYFF